MTHLTEKLPGHLEFPIFDWFTHDQADCPSLAMFCDHCTTCGAAVDRFTVAGIPACNNHFEELNR